jgi:tRNA dimethylallyltransferase
MSSIGDSAGASLPVICGPTASGKSGLALRIAETLGASIISADSRQVYRGFDIGRPSLTSPSNGSCRTSASMSPSLMSGTALRSGQRRFPGGWRPLRPQGGGRSWSGGRASTCVRCSSRFLTNRRWTRGDARLCASCWRACPLRTFHRWTEAIDPARASLGRSQRERAIEVALIHRASHQ